MTLDGFGIFVDDIDKMVKFYRDVLSFEIEYRKGDGNVFLRKDGVLFLMYGKKDFEKMTSRKFSYAKGINGHFEISLSVENYAEVDRTFNEVVGKGAVPVMEPTTEPWEQRTSYIADIEGNIIEIGSFNK